MVSVSSDWIPESIFSGVATGSDVMVEFMVVEATRQMIVCYSGCEEDRIDDGEECRNDSRYLSFH